jgi:microcystin-dependent protein
MEQEVSWGIVQSATEVRRVGDTADTAIEWKDAELDLSVGDRVVIVRASSTDSWVVACVLDEIAAPAVSPFMPTGTFLTGGWTTAPSGFLLMNGVAIVGGATLYPALATMFPAWVSGTTLTPPNAAGASLLASTGTLGAVSGSMSVTLIANNLPSHNHSITHDHDSFTTSSGGSHNHGLLSSSTSAGTGGFDKTNTSSGTAFATSTGNHTHSIDVPNFTGTSGNNTTTNAAIDITGRNLTVRVAVKT